jgi:hypothetical protein
MLNSKNRNNAINTANPFLPEIATTINVPVTEIIRCAESFSVGNLKEFLEKKKVEYLMRRRGRGLFHCLLPHRAGLWDLFVNEYLSQKWEIIEPKEIG